MSEAPVIVERLFHTSIEAVWEALTNKEQLKQWYFALDDFKAEPGFEFSFTGQGHQGTQYLHLCKVLEVEPLRKITYSWTFQGYEGYSTVTWELQDTATGTLVRIIHTGLETFPQDNPDFAKDSFNGGWTYFMYTALPRFLGETTPQ